MSKSFTIGKVDAARHEKNLWKRRAASSEIALRRIGAVLRHAEDGEGVRTDEQLLEEIWEIHQDWVDAYESQSTTPIKSMKVKAYIYPLTEDERTKAEDALEKWLDSGAPINAGVDTVLDAVASLRDPETSRGDGL